eukprot:ANDGO_03229.mRNA.1 hypothetical protein AMSG_00915
MPPKNVPKEPEAPPPTPACVLNEDQQSRLSSAEAVVKQLRCAVFSVVGTDFQHSFSATEKSQIVVDRSVLSAFLAANPGVHPPVAFDALDVHAKDVYNALVLFVASKQCQFEEEARLEREKLERERLEAEADAETEAEAEAEADADAVDQKEEEEADQIFQLDFVIYLKQLFSNAAGLLYALNGSVLRVDMLAVADPEDSAQSATLEPYKSIAEFEKTGDSEKLRHVIIQHFQPKDTAGIRSAVEDVIDAKARYAKFLSTTRIVTVPDFVSPSDLVMERYRQTLSRSAEEPIVAVVDSLLRVLEMEQIAEDTPSELISSFFDLTMNSKLSVVGSVSAGSPSSAGASRASGSKGRRIAVWPGEQHTSLENELFASYPLQFSPPSFPSSPPPSSVLTEFRSFLPDSMTPVQLQVALALSLAHQAAAKQGFSHGLHQLFSHSVVEYLSVGGLRDAIAAARAKLLFASTEVVSYNPILDQMILLLNVEVPNSRMSSCSLSIPLKSYPFFRDWTEERNNKAEETVGDEYDEGTAPSVPRIRLTGFSGTGGSEYFVASSVAAEISTRLSILYPSDGSLIRVLSTTDGLRSNVSVVFPAGVVARQLISRSSIDNASSQMARPKKYVPRDADLFSTNDVALLVSFEDDTFVEARRFSATESAESHPVHHELCYSDMKKGYHASLSSAGSVTLWFSDVTQRAEEARTIFSDGRIVVQNRDGSRKAYLPDGSILLSRGASCNEWILTSATGSRVRRTEVPVQVSRDQVSATDSAQGGSSDPPVEEKLVVKSESLSSLDVAQNLDIETSSIVYSREDLTMFVEYPSASVVMRQYADGTRTWLYSSTGILHVEKEGLPTTEVNIGVQTIAVRGVGTVMSGTVTIRSLRATVSCHSVALSPSDLEYSFNMNRGGLRVNDASGHRYTVASSGEGFVRLSSDPEYGIPLKAESEFEDVDISLSPMPGNANPPAAENTQQKTDHQGAEEDKDEDEDEDEDDEKVAFIPSVAEQTHDSCVFVFNRDGSGFQLWSPRSVGHVLSDVERVVWDRAQESETSGASNSISNDEFEISLVQEPVADDPSSTAITILKYRGPSRGSSNSKADLQIPRAVIPVIPGPLEPSRARGTLYTRQFLRIERSLFSVLPVFDKWTQWTARRAEFNKSIVPSSDNGTADDAGFQRRLLDALHRKASKGVAGISHLNDMDDRIAAGDLLDPGSTSTAEPVVADAASSAVSTRPARPPRNTLRDEIPQSDNYWKVPAGQDALADINQMMIDPKTGRAIPEEDLVDEGAFSESTQVLASVSDGMVGDFRRHRYEGSSSKNAVPEGGARDDDEEDVVFHGDAGSTGEFQVKEPRHSQTGGFVSTNPLQRKTLRSSLVSGRPVPLPAVNSLKRNVAASELNAKQDNTQRSVTTASTTLAGKGLSNIIARPPELRFGTVPEGRVYRMSFQLSNVGNEVGRFRVAKPRSRDIDVIYSPGPLAPGMSRQVDVEISAGGVGDIAEDLKVVTATHIIHVSVFATIAYKDDAQKNLKANVRVVENAVPGGLRSKVQARKAGIDTWPTPKVSPVASRSASQSGVFHDEEN